MSRTSEDLDSTEDTLTHEHDEYVLYDSASSQETVIHVNISGESSEEMRTHDSVLCDSSQETHGPGSCANNMDEEILHESDWDQDILDSDIHIKDIFYDPALIYDDADEPSNYTAYQTETNDDNDDESNEFEIPCPNSTKEFEFSCTSSANEFEVPYKNSSNEFEVQCTNSSPEMNEMSEMSDVEDKLNKNEGEEKLFIKAASAYGSSLSENSNSTTDISQEMPVTIEDLPMPRMSQKNEMSQEMPVNIEDLSTPRVLPKNESVSTQSYLARHRKLNRQSINANWEDITKDTSFMKHMSRINQQLDGSTSDFKTTQVTALNGLIEGRSLLLEGHLPRKAFTFAIHLQSGPGRIPNGDVRTILFMFSPLIQEKRISCNSFLYGDWGVEEMWDVERLRTESDFEDFPFYPGGRFRIRFMVDNDQYSVYVDGRHLLDYRHRLSIDLISHVRLEGDAIFTTTECPMAMDLPHIVDLPTGLRAGHMIILDTFVWKSCKSFEVQITARQQDIYALFVTQTTFQGDITRVQCNAFLNGDQRDQVLIDGHLPLNRDQNMVLKFLVEETVFRVYVNDNHFADYEHQLPVEKLTQLSVCGDISLYGVKIKRPPGSTLQSLRKASGCCDCCLL